MITKPATRHAITIFDEDCAHTILKPFSDEYKDMYYVLFEDAYGEAIGEMIPESNLKFKLNLTDDEFNECINALK
jgi:hypothetical protein